MSARTVYQKLIHSNVCLGHGVEFTLRLVDEEAKNLPRMSNEGS